MTDPAQRAEALARATLANGLIQAAIHFPHVTQAMGLDESRALDQATALAEEAIALDPTLPDGHCALARVLLCSELEQAHRDARAVLEHALELDPDHDPAHVALAVLDREAGRLDSALARLDRVVRSGNAHPLTFVLRGSIHAARGERSEARLDFTRVMKLAPESGLVDAELLEAGAWSEAEHETIRKRAEQRLGARYPWIRAALQRSS